MLRKRAIEHEKIKFVWNVTVDEVLGDQRVEGAVLNDLNGGGQTRMDDLGAVFVAIGHRPATDFLQGKLDMDDHGYLITDERTRTSIPGVYAVGDVRQFAAQYAQAVIAAGDGCIAALEATRYLDDPKWIEDETEA
jgi:thioredoxin reductase (NADPH)